MKAYRLLVLSLVFAMTGCFKYTIRSGNGGDMGSTPIKASKNHFVVGLIGDTDINVNSMCSSSDATVEIERSIIDVLLNDLTWVIGLGWVWQPSTVTVFCGSNKSAMVIDQATALRLASSDEFVNAAAELAPDRFDEALDLNAAALASR